MRTIAAMTVYDEKTGSELSIPAGYPVTEATARSRQTKYSFHKWWDIKVTIGGVRASGQCEHLYFAPGG